MKRFAMGILFVMLIQGTTSFAAGKSGCMTGTYLVQEGSGTQSLWTFSKDGTILISSSAQGPLNFGDIQGAWKQTGNKAAHVTALDFNYGSTSVPAAVARIDVVATFSNQCTRMQGSFSLRFFTPGIEDPLDPSTDTGAPITDTFAGRKVLPH
jgi:hypothetical protein